MTPLPTVTEPAFPDTTDRGLGAAATPEVQKPEGNYTPEQVLARRLRRVNVALYGKVVAESDVRSFFVVPCLLELYARGESGFITPGEMADIHGCSRAAVTGQIDTLEKAGLVRRDRGTDRRGVLVRLTSLARYHVAEALTEFDRHVD